MADLLHNAPADQVQGASPDQSSLLTSLAWEEIGRVIVDSGNIVITEAFDRRGIGVASRRMLDSYSQHVIDSTKFFIKHHRVPQRDEIEPASDAEETRSGVVIGGFGGDSTYPVYALRTPTGMIRAVFVDFDRVITKGP